MMGHKKNKKSSNDSEDLSQSDTNTDATNSEDPQSAEVNRKPKKSKKKHAEHTDAEPETLNNEEQMPVVHEQKKEKRKRGRKPANYIPPEMQNSDSPATVDEEMGQVDQKMKVEKVKGKKNNNNMEEEKVIDWPEKDLSELFRRMEASIPEKDTLAFSTRAEKLNWDDIAFKQYTSEECKGTWLLVQKRLRRFRLLSELLSDAKEWITKPWTNFYGGQKTKRHPDMPRRPLSTYMLFYLQKKDKIIAENPGLEMTEISKLITQLYKALSPAKREKYMKEAADKRKIYEIELEEFYRVHPEVPRNLDKQPHHKLVAETGPKKPNSPFMLYYESKLKSLNQNVYVDKHNFKEQCKEQWKNMSDKKKVIWINWALDEETKYQDELKNYMLQNPDFVPIPVKPVLTKEEKLIRERMAGKPVKPPNSSYSLFSRMMLQSEEIKEVNPKDRMVVIAERWKNCTEEERKQYSERILHLREQYKLDFASYLESLSEEKRQEELRNNMPKRKRSMNEEPMPIIKKKKADCDGTEYNNHKIQKKSIKEDPEEGRATKSTKEDDFKKSEDSDSKKLSPFARPPYWNRMKKEEKQTFKNAMMKLKEHLDSRFEKYISSRSSDTSEDSDDSEDSDSSSSS